MSRRKEATHREDRSSATRTTSARGYTFDTGALVFLQGRDDRAKALFDEITRRQVTVTVPMPVLAEWWRGPGMSNVNKLLVSVEFEEVSEHVARLAGEALAKSMPAEVGDRTACTACGRRPPPPLRPSAVDAIVVVSAALRGDIVYTSDEDDLRQVAWVVFHDMRLCPNPMEIIRV